VVLGYINPEYILGGTMKLDKGKAEEAIRVHVADPLGMSVVEAAAGIYQIVNAHMTDLIRKISVERGYDPREFTIFAFGGAGATHCTGYTPELGAKRVVVPSFQTVFSAFGIAASDIRHSFARSHYTILEKEVEKINVGEMNAIYRQLLEQADEQFRLDGIATGVRLERAIDLRYERQTHELTLTIPWDDELNYDNLQELHKLWKREYEKEYGAGTAPQMAAVEVINLRVTGTAPSGFDFHLKASTDSGSTPPGEALAGRRPVYWLENKDYSPTDIYVGEKLKTGNTIERPAVVEFFGSTLPLPREQRLVVDEYGNAIITLL
jgi:N-methylhydantoinase A